MRELFILLTVFLLVGGSHAAIDSTACVQDAADEGKSVVLTGAEAELVKVVKEMKEAEADFWTELRELEDPEEQLAYYRTQNPLSTFLPQLLKIEEKHRGADVGLSALVQITNRTGSGGELDSPNNRVRPEAIRRMQYYVTHPLFPHLLTSFSAGTANGRLEGPIRELLTKIPEGTANHRWAQYYLAEYLVTYRKMREAIQVLPYPDKEQERILGTLPSSQQLLENASEGEFLLEMLSILPPSEFRMPKHDSKGGDGEGILLKMAADDAWSNNSVSNRAKGLLFRERYLAEGSPMPEVKVSLLGSQPWSLEEQRGKVVILMFSFKGCGPCERMYPVLKEIHKQYSESVEILSLLCDPEPEISAEYAKEKELAWNVTWDGDHGPQATQWGVTWFPTVFVYDQEGKMVGELGDRDLRQLVADLLKE